MNDAKIECLCKKLSKANQRITLLECKNYGLKKENESLERRIDLLTNRPFPRHYSDEEMCSCFKQELDPYTLEKVFYTINKLIEHKENRYPHITEPFFKGIISGNKETLAVIWRMLDDDSKEWIKKGKEKYYE